MSSRRKFIKQSSLAGLAMVVNDFNKIKLLTPDSNKRFCI